MEEQTYFTDGDLRKFLPELVPEIVLHIQHVPLLNEPGLVPLNDDRNGQYLYRRPKVLGWLFSCCLVCHYWKELFTPALYREIVIDQDRMPILLRTLWHTRPQYRNSIHTLIIKGKEYSDTTPFLHPFPNLTYFALDDFELSRCSPIFPRILKLLPHTCKIDICGRAIDANSIPALIHFIRQAQPDQFSCTVYKPSAFSNSPKSSTAILQIGRCCTRIYLVCMGTAVVFLNACLKFVSHYLVELELDVRTQPENSGKKLP